MNHTEYSVLRHIMDEPGATQRHISVACDISLGSVNNAMKALRSKGFIADDCKITKAGLKALQPYKVKNAVIMAAGLSSRFAPISFEHPKGMLNVRGECSSNDRSSSSRKLGSTTSP